jgi:hypothetical protein
MSTRREFITLLGGAAAAWPGAARGQRSERRLIGILTTLAESDAFGQSSLASFREALQKLGRTAAMFGSRFAGLGGRAVAAEIRQRSRCAAARPHSRVEHALHGSIAAANPHDSNHFPSRLRSGRQRLRSKFFEARRQRHRVHQYRGLSEWQVAGVAQGDCAARHSGSI